MEDLEPDGVELVWHLLCYHMKTAALLEGMKIVSLDLDSKEAGPEGDAMALGVGMPWRCPRLFSRGSGRLKRPLVAVYQDLGPRWGVLQ